MVIRRISQKEIRGALAPGMMPEAAPAGISPVLRASWKFAHKWAKRFNQELLKDRVAEFLKKLAKRFV